jgi:hypothetical protein
MKDRILYGWNARRALYLIMGIAVIIYAVIAKEWWGVLLGSYFAVMGLFNWGCASGNCSYEPRRRHRNEPDRQPFEEIKAE